MPISDIYLCYISLVLNISVFNLNRLYCSGTGGDSSSTSSSASSSTSASIIIVVVLNGMVLREI